MKSSLLLMVCALAASATAAATAGATASAPQPLQGYHEAAGVPLAARVRQHELALASGRIIGGVPVNVGAHPYLGGLIITLVDGRTSICGASLLRPRKALTAAHCWWDGRAQARLFTVVYGSERLFVGGTRVSTSDVEIHASFNPVTYANDIAIITHPYVEYTAYIQPIQPASGSLTYADTWATAVGYGRSSNEVMSVENSDKRQVMLHVMTNANCRLTWATVMIGNGVLCTSSAGGMSVCAGDSGGPLVIGAGADRTLIGIVSFGADAGCSFGFPAAHTRVTAYSAWIDARL
ncbi:collagenase-like [Ostrinia nubilalis]|uniref:collagenase-like n=1 Tax=Ostrinia nubilalis TaxID=29057 RepID=UPI0030825473